MPNIAIQSMGVSILIKRSFVIHQNVKPNLHGIFHNSCNHIQVIEYTYLNQKAYLTDDQNLPPRNFENFQKAKTSQNEKDACDLAVKEFGQIHPMAKEEFQNNIRKNSYYP